MYIDYHHIWQPISEVSQLVANQHHTLVALLTSPGMLFLCEAYSNRIIKHIDMASLLSSDVDISPSSGESQEGPVSGKPAQLASLCFCPDSRYVAMLDRSTLRILVVDTAGEGRITKEYMVRYKGVCSIECDPWDEQAFLSTEGEIVYLDYQKNKDGLGVEVAVRQEAQVDSLLEQRIKTNGTLTNGHTKPFSGCLAGFVVALSSKEQKTLVVYQDHYVQLVRLQVSTHDLHRVYSKTTLSRVFVNKSVGLTSFKFNHKQDLLALNFGAREIRLMNIDFQYLTLSYYKSKEHQAVSSNKVFSDMCFMCDIENSANSYLAYLECHDRHQVIGTSILYPVLQDLQRDTKVAIQMGPEANGRHLLYLKPQWNQIMILGEQGRVGIFQIQVNESWVGLNYNFKKIEQQEAYVQEENEMAEPMQDLHLDLDINDLANRVNVVRRQGWDMKGVLQRANPFIFLE